MSIASGECSATASSSSEHGKDRSSESRDMPKERPVGEQNHKGQVMYCVCRSTRVDEFMIACDRCSEWFHGPCVDIEQSFSKNIDRYYCELCLQLDGSLNKFVFKKRYQKELDRQKLGENSVQLSVTKRCGQCIGCIRLSICEKCSGCETGEDCVKMRCVQLLNTTSVQRKVGRPRRDRVETKSADESDEPLSPLPSSTAPFGDQPDKPKRGRKKGWRKDQQILTKTEIRVKAEDPDYSEVTQQRNDRALVTEISRAAYGSYTAYRRAKSKNTAQNEAPRVRQCFEPDCIREAREGSKYCSDECGRKLARARLREILPGKVDEFWCGEPQAQTRGKIQLVELEAEYNQLGSRVKSLLEHCQMIDKFVKTVKDIDPAVLDEDFDQDTLANCTVCSAEVSSRQLVKHIERCFAKSEKQITFGTAAKAPVNPDGLFCDTFNKQTQTYCKRLRVLCAEHYKGDLENEMMICGCPDSWGKVLASDSVSSLCKQLDPSLISDICINPRKECTLHHRWLQNILGVLECERYSLLARMDELGEKANNIKLGAQFRGDVITLLCNQTILSDVPVKQEID